MQVEKNKDYLGRVVNNEDWTFQGRCQISIPGLTDSISEEMLPWFTCGSWTTFGKAGAGAMSVPRVGADVRVRFKNGEFQNGEYFCLAKPDPDMVRELGQDYFGCQCLVFDSESDFSIRFHPNSAGLVIYYKGSMIQIRPDNTITINYGSGNSKIELTDGKITLAAQNQIDIVSGDNVNISGKTVNLLGSEGTNIKAKQCGAEPGVNGKALMTLLESLAAGIDSKAPVGTSYQALVAASKEGILNHDVEYV